jgi:hypothetical protein
MTPSYETFAAEHRAAGFDEVLVVQGGMSQSAR